MGKLTYIIGGPTEEEQMRLDFQDGLSRLMLPNPT